MNGLTGALAFGNAAVAATLLRAASAKLVNARTTAAALVELRLARLPDSVLLIKATAVAEAAAALAIGVGAVALPDRVLIGVLGAVFAALGVLGRRRASVLPCGCFGAGGHRPLGWSNVLSGLAMVGLAVADVAWRREFTADVNAATSLLAVVFSAVWLLVLHRGDAKSIALKFLPSEAE
jgi:hypothetical protein